MQLVDRIVAPLRRPAGGAAAGMAGAAPALVSFALVLVIAAQLASLLWRALGTSEGDSTDAAPVVQAPAPNVDIAAVVNAHLFGVAPQSGDPSDAPATTANLALAGTLAGLEPEHGWAIIGASGQTARVYATGASLPGGAKLFAVYPDRVILDRNGARESLLMPRLGERRRWPRCAARRGAAAGRAPDASIADSVRQLLVQNPSAGCRAPAPAAGVRRRLAARLSRLPGPQPRPVREPRLAARGSRPGGERRGARRPQPRARDPARRRPGIRSHADRRARRAAATDHGRPVGCRPGAAGARWNRGRSGRARNRSRRNRTS